jgi:hypothetical protein
MALRVQISKGSASQRVSVAEPAKINTNISKVQLSSVDLEALNNVDTETNGLQDGYTLVYNSTTNQWITQSVTNVSVGNIDGGFF